MRVLISFLILFCASGASGANYSAPLVADESSSNNAFSYLQTDYVQQDNTIEQIKNIRGQLEELQHENQKLKDKLQNLSTDMQARIAALEDLMQKKTSESIPSSKSSAQQAYQEAYAFVKSNNPKAIQALKEFMNKYPKSNFISHAHYGIGEMHFNAGHYNEAAVEYLKGYKASPTGEKASDNLFKLGKSLQKMQKNKEACTTFLKLQAEFPKSSNKEKTIELIKTLKCK